MNHRLRISGFLIVGIVAISLSLSGCFFTLASEYEDLINYKIYLIDSSTILDSIKGGKKVGYTIIPEIPTISPEINLYQNTWKMDDYLLIAQDYFHNILGESLEDWKLSQIDTNRDCNYINRGYGAINFTFFEEINQKDDYIRLVHFLNIVPDGNYIYESETKYTQLNENWKSIDYKNNKISEEAALLISEKVGGEAYRVKYLNDCWINIGFHTYEGDGKSWHFTYISLNEKNPEKFDVFINADNGQYRIVGK